MPGVSNQFQQPVDMTPSDWRGAPSPQAQQITGRYCKLERINTERHVKKLYETYCETNDYCDWTYLAVGPFETFDAFLVYLKDMGERIDPVRFVVIDLTNMKPVGTFALMCINPANGMIEVGHVSYSVRTGRMRISTEVIPLLLKYVFEDLGYRRFEQKCNAFNTPSHRAAERFDFSSEGIFRQAIVTCGRGRGTAWHSIIDGEYPTLRPVYDLWLDEGDFDSQGWQIRHLGELMERG